MTLIAVYWVIGILALILLLGCARTIMLQYGDTQHEFLAGKAVMPQGLWPGVLPGYTTSWQGKKFTGDTGINVFSRDGKNVDVYPFKTYIARGAVDPIDVVKIDYNTKGNPFWLRLILDEVVQVKPNEYLGKLQLRLVPGLPITLLYFRLER